MPTILAILTATLSAKRRIVLSGIVRAAEEIGCRVQTVEGRPTQRQLDRLIDFWHPHGLVIECSCGKIAYRRFGGVPTVFIDHDDTAEIPCVRNDSPAIGRLVATELLSLGLHDFAFVGWFRRAYWCEEKRAAFADIISLHGTRIVQFYPMAEEEKDEIALQKRLRAWLRELPRPCGVFAINDAIGERVLLAAAEEGIAVPDELAVISVDNDETICERTRPTLTSVMPAFAEIGYQAVKTLEARERTRMVTKIPPLNVVHRQSSRIIKRARFEIDAALELIRKKACSGLRASEVAKIFGCSRRLAEIEFQRTTGMTILKAIHQERLQRACQLLENPKIPIKTVATNCGWNSDIIFRRIFTKTFGHTPRHAARHRSLLKGDCAVSCLSGSSAVRP